MKVENWFRLISQLVIGLYFFAGMLINNQSNKALCVLFGIWVGSVAFINNKITF